MNAYYASNIGEFLNVPVEAIRDALVMASGRQFFSLKRTQGVAWRKQINILRAALSFVRDHIASAKDWGILLEFSIPRRQRRIDAVILAHNLIVVLEFKSSVSARSRAAARQVEDYALNLADFHLPSQNRRIIPVLVTPGTPDVHPPRRAEWVQSVWHTDPDQLGSALLSAFESCSNPENQPLDRLVWERSSYLPAPNIIEAATALYARASVREIAHSHSGVESLTKTTGFILKAAQEAQHNGNKVICFVTGIPGAGKTLAGLNLVHSPEIREEGRPASVFISGNGPLVKILRAALVMDSVKNKRETKTDAEYNASAFIQNVHHFVSAHLNPNVTENPPERVVVFDEAQRAWNATRNEKRYPDEGPLWHVSEPEMILRIMDRHSGWAMVVALVGGGQEINEGEAGLAAWGAALEKFPSWRVLASPEALEGGQSVAGNVLFTGDADKKRVAQEPTLHLDTFVRSPKAEKVAEWVNALLIGKSARAAEIAREFENFPVSITRDISTAREWLRSNTRGERRCGLIASSGAARLRAFGIETSTGFRHGYPYERWFLASPEDVRSSFQLEVVASEFEIQGLELDNVGVCWGGDFVWNRHSQSWFACTFRGSQWQAVQASERYEQARNKYRVLLTRARRGLLIWVPRGNTSDPTQNVEAMTETADYLRGCGCGSLDPDR